MTLDDAGGVSSTVLRDAWGVYINSAGESERYGGIAQREIDSESGLVHMRHRMYDPLLGRFTQGDPILSRRPSAHYAYAANNPISFNDPLGLAEIYVHGVDATGRSSYGSFQAELRKQRAKVPNAQSEISIDFNWAYEVMGEPTKHWNPATNASDGFGDIGSAGETIVSGGMSKQQWRAALRLASTIVSLRSALNKVSPEEPINIVAHSQGTNITVAALYVLKVLGFKREDLGVNTLVLMGSPLDKEDAENRQHQTNSYIDTAAGMISGKMKWYWSDEDGVAKIKGGIGKYGLNTARFGNTNYIEAIEMKGVDHFDFGGGTKGWWASTWIGNNKVSLQDLISTSKNPVNVKGNAELQKLMKDANAWGGVVNVGPFVERIQHGKLPPLPTPPKR